MYEHDKRIVLTLDAGGTNFVFSALSECKQVVEDVCLPAVTDDIEQCLNTLVKGFETVKNLLNAPPVAISFAFPGPADYENGIIGNLPNFKAFSGGVALGPYIQKKFNIPVYINNDGNLFALGEAMFGILPQVNKQLKEKGSKHKYQNLLAVTLGTGFGAGVVINGRLLTGDNGCGGDMWIFRNKLYPQMIAEEGISIRGIKRVYEELSGENTENLSPKDIYDIAEGKKKGNKQAAAGSFAALGETAGDAISHAISIVDGLIVIGGGISAASKYFLPSLLHEMNTKLQTFSGETFPRLEMKAYNLTDDQQLNEFLDNKGEEITLPFGTEKVHYNQSKRTGIAVSTLGTNKAIALGAYAYALTKLDES